MVKRLILILLCLACSLGASDLPHRRVHFRAKWWLSGGVTATPVAVYQPVGAADLAASYINLANSGTNNAAPGTAPTFDAASGWTFDGTQYLTTGIVPSSYSWSVVCKFSGVAADRSQVVMGGRISGETGLLIFATNGSGALIFDNGGRLIIASASVTNGTMAIAGKSAYVNGALVGTIPAGALSASAIYLGAGNVNPATGSCIIGKISSVAIYSGTLTAAQVAAIHGAMP